MRETAVEVPTRVLVFGMTRPDGTVGAADLYDVAAACDQTSEQVRSCLRRLVSEGLLEREGSGRTANYRMTERSEQIRRDTAQRHRLAYHQDHKGQGWGGTWHLVAFAIPEDRRTARDRLRDRLLESGGAVVSNGLYVSPHPWDDDVREAAASLGVTDCLTLAGATDLEIAGVSDPRELARSLWPVDDLAASYQRFVDGHEPVLARLRDLHERHGRISDADLLPGALRTVVAFQDVFRRDPLLPPELLPRPWPGRAARNLLVTGRRLALRLREEHERPALFTSFDQLVEQSS